MVYNTLITAEEPVSSNRCNVLHSVSLRATLLDFGGLPRFFLKMAIGSGESWAADLDIWPISALTSAIASLNFCVVAPIENSVKCGSSGLIESVETSALCSVKKITTNRASRKNKQESMACRRSASDWRRASFWG